MSDYDNNMRGVLFKNDNKQKPNQPDIKGSGEVDGVEYWISGWKKEGKTGAFYSLSFTPKEGAQKPSTKVEDDLDDEIAF